MSNFIKNLSSCKTPYVSPWLSSITTKDRSWGKRTRITKFLWVCDLRLGRGVSLNFQPRRVSRRLLISMEIVTTRKQLSTVNLSFAAVDSGFLGVTIYIVTFSHAVIIYIVVCIYLLKYIVGVLTAFKKLLSC